MKIKPFSCYRPTPAAAPQFVSLPYDVFTLQEARAYVAAHPASFLGIDYPEANFDTNAHPSTHEVLAKARELLDTSIAQGTLIPDNNNCLYLYELTRDNHTQTGVVATCEVQDYLNGVIKKHELTRQDKEEGRVAHIKACDAQTGPIFLAYQDTAQLSSLIAQAKDAPTLYDFISVDGVHQRVWQIIDENAITSFQKAFEAVPTAYIADGHHRCAAAAQSALDEGNGQVLEDRPSARFLSVLFAASELCIYPYHRVLCLEQPIDTKTLVEALAAQGAKVTEVSGASDQQAAMPDVSQNNPTTLLPTQLTRDDHHVGMYLTSLQDVNSGKWYSIDFSQSISPKIYQPHALHKASCLAASWLQERVLEPLFGVQDPRSDPRLSFYGGDLLPYELLELAQKQATTAQSQGGSCAALAIFYMPAVSIFQIMDIADANEVMPPKATWFEPKLQSGFFIRPLHLIEN